MFSIVIVFWLAKLNRKYSEHQLPTFVFIINLNVFHFVYFFHFFSFQINTYKPKRKYFRHGIVKCKCNKHKKQHGTIFFGFGPSSPPHGGTVWHIFGNWCADAQHFFHHHSHSHDKNTLPSLRFSAFFSRVAKSKSNSIVLSATLLVIKMTKKKVYVVTNRKPVWQRSFCSFCFIFRCVSTENKNGNKERTEMAAVEGKYTFYLCILILYLYSTIMNERKFRAHWGCCEKK